MNIINKPTVTLEQCKTWIAGIKYASKLATDNMETLYNAAVNNGIDPAVLIAQCMLETGYFKFGGVIDASFHNTCGLKTTKGGSNYSANAHMRFKTWKEGIQAHADHLALYAGAKNFPKYSPNCASHPNDKYKSNGATQDPRHFTYLYGKCKTVESLEGTWATSKGYANKIKAIIEQIKNIKKSTTNKYKNGSYNQQARITASSLNIRKGRPGSKEYNTILGKYKKGETVTVWYCLNNWFGVTYKGKQGFVCGDYIDLIE